MKFRCVPTSVVLLCFLTVTPAQAYLDPATGSMIVQLILGGLAGIALGLKLFWRRIFLFFGVRTGEDGDSES